MERHGFRYTLEVAMCWNGGGITRQRMQRATAREACQQRQSESSIAHRLLDGGFAMAPRRGLFSQPSQPQLLAWLPWALMAIALCGWGLWFIRAPGVLGGGWAGRRAGSGLRLEPGQPTARGRTLVVYVFSGSDPEYADNLRFFISEAVKVRAAAGGRLQSALLGRGLQAAQCSNSPMLALPLTSS